MTEGVAGKNDYENSFAVDVDSHAGPYRVKGVSKYVCRSVNCPQDERDGRRRMFLQELEHWNQFTRNTHDSLQEMATRLVDWQTSYNYMSKIASALLYPSISQQLMDERVVRESIRRGYAIRKVTTSTEEPQFPCGKCGRRLHDVKSARWHCKSGWGQKRRK